MPFVSFTITVSSYIYGNFALNKVKFKFKLNKELHVILIRVSGEKLDEPKKKKNPSIRLVWFFGVKL